MAFGRTDQAGKLETGSQCCRNFLRRENGGRGLDDLMDERVGGRNQPKMNLRPGARALAQPWCH